MASELVSGLDSFTAIYVASGYVITIYNGDIVVLLSTGIRQNDPLDVVKTWRRWGGGGVVILR